ncbi:MAG: hypothetical protein ACOXZ5_02120 [Syntrophomonadaceae bacterium]|jgi:UDP-GlcNAc:undecaprenyl-phosphate GlcNAc-1-phosphate transferase
MYWGITIISVITAFIIEAIVLYFTLGLLRDGGAIRKNYKGAEIPVSAGISFPITVILIYIIYSLAGIFAPTHQLFLFGITSISFLGFIDDMLGSRDTTGFKGHIGLLLKGKMTTGGLKALGGGMIAFFLALSISRQLSEIVINLLLIALFTNALNLMDLRPGRAIKVYLLGVLVLALGAAGRLDWVMISPLLGAVICYFYTDLKARAMMGDSGSNVLGISLGFACAISLALIFKIFIVILLIGIHILAERYSITRIIENVPILRAIDDLGRG